MSQGLSQGLSSGSLRSIGFHPHGKLVPTVPPWGLDFGQILQVIGRVNPSHKYWSLAMTMPNTIEKNVQRQTIIGIPLSTNSNEKQKLDNYLNRVSIKVHYSWAIWLFTGLCFYRDAFAAEDGSVGSHPAMARRQHDDYDITRSLPPKPDWGLSHFSTRIIP